MWGNYVTITYSLEWGVFFEKSEVFRSSSSKDLPELPIGAILRGIFPQKQH